MEVHLKPLTTVFLILIDIKLTSTTSNVNICKEMLRTFQKTKPLTGYINIRASEQQVTTAHLNKETVM